MMDWIKIFTITTIAILAGSTMLFATWTHYLTIQNSRLDYNLTISESMREYYSNRSDFWRGEAEMYKNSSDFWENETFFWISEVDYWENMYLDAKNSGRDYEVIASDVSSAHKYNSKTYNCVNFSNDLIKALEDAGYMAWRIEGYYGVTGHAWVMMGLPIEATTGEVISPEEYKKYYTEGFAG